MKKTSMTALLAATAMLLLTGFYSGCSRRSKNPAEVATWVEDRVTSRVEDVLEDVDASEEQTQQIVADARRVVQETWALHGVKDEALELLRQEWTAEQVNAERMHNLIDRRMDDLRKVLHLAADAFAKTHRTLTPDQRRQLLEEL